MAFDLIVAVFGVAVLAMLSLYGDMRFAGREIVPVHWGLDKRPNGYAPRHVALGIFPVIGGAVLCGLAAALAPPWPVLAIIGGGLAIGNLLYFEAIARTLD